MSRELSLNLSLEELSFIESIFYAHLNSFNDDEANAIIERVYFKVDSLIKGN